MFQVHWFEPVHFSHAFPCVHALIIPNDCYQDAVSAPIIIYRFLYYTSLATRECRIISMQSLFYALADEPCSCSHSNMVAG